MFKKLKNSLKTKNTSYFMEATEKSCEGPNIGPNSQNDIVEVDSLSETPKFCHAKA